MDYRIHPLSENAVTLYLEQRISPEINDMVIGICEWIESNPFEGFVELVPAYSSVTIYYDLVKVNAFYQQSPFKFLKTYLGGIPFDQLQKSKVDQRIIEIPVDYSGEDLETVAEYNKLSVKEVIEVHSEPLYRVYMMGFLPGFPYLGGLSPQIATPRKEKPRLKVKAGSVGIAGNQTGIYPLDSPGGWQIIGHTKRKLFSPNEKKLTLLKTGDMVRFISK
ncbi:5-oxoprolinase subunit PxpB [Jiulongibacter sp. NS-SX5]|uniref:5-oxoprolinase subunit PxpB n=1 Tax=Jiulongibacter sp. NS-SX5 TaxID=3463854 RepID=UPI00405976B6